MAMPAPTVLATFHDPSASISNAVFTHVSTITDGQAWALLVGLIVAVLFVAAFATGRAPAGLRELDFVSTSIHVVGSINIGGFLPTRKTSKFGGLLSTLAVVAICALCADVLVEYTGDYGHLQTVTVPALDPNPRAAPNGRVQIDVTAQRVGSTTSICSVHDLTPSSTLAATFFLAAKSSTYAVSGDTTSALTCSFSAVASSVVVQLPVYATSGSSSTNLPPAALSFGLGPYLQATAWTVTVSDGKGGAYTSASPGAL